jgi:hypothetical protein
MAQRIGGAQAARIKHQAEGSSNKQTLKQQAQA